MQIHRLRSINGWFAAFADTFAVHLPCWRFRVVTAGYEPGKWTKLDELQYRRQTRRAGPGTSKLVAPASLEKRHARPAGRRRTGP